MAPPNTSHDPRDPAAHDPAIDRDDEQTLYASYDALQDQAERVSDDIGRWVRRAPGQAVLLGIAAGFLIGMLFRGDRRP